MKAAAIVPLALITGFLYGHGFEIAMDVVPILIVASLAYLAIAVFERQPGTARTRTARRPVAIARAPKPRFAEPEPRPAIKPLPVLSRR